MAVQTGVNEDDKFHYGYTDLLMDYYGSMGENEAALNVEKGRMHLYGGLVDILNGVSASIFGIEQGTSAYGVVRHLIIGLIGLLAFLFTGLLTRRIGGWRAGIIALIVIFLTPRFSGHAIINPRDIPFAAGYIMSIYFMVRFFSEIPKVSWKTVFGLAGGLALAFATRSGGLLLFAYFGLFGLVHMWRAFADKSVSNSGLFMSYIKYGGIAAVTGYAVALLFWPYGLNGPISNVMNSLTEFSNYKTVLRMLFDGNMIWSTDIPPSKYIFTWLSIGLPLVLLSGLIMVPIFAKGIFKRSNRFYVGIALFIFVFPILYILYKQSNLYTGMRHLLFLVPPLAVLAAIGWDYLIRYFEASNKMVSYVVAGVFGVLALLPLSHMATNFKTSYVYFNEIIGGVSGALGKYEMDYWGVSQKRAVEWMEEQGIFDTDEPLLIRSNSDFVLKQYTKKYPNVKVGYGRFRERYERDWDYAIFINQFIDGAHLRAGQFADGNVIKVIGKGDTPFCMIYKNPKDKNATKGFVALKQKNFDEAIRLFSIEVEANPTNENALNGLGQAYFNKQMYNEGYVQFNKALEINPESQTATTYITLSLLNLNRLDDALGYLDKSIAMNKKDFTSLYYRGMIYYRKGDMNTAIRDLKAALDANGRHKPSYQLLIDIYKNMGDQQNANRFTQLMNQYAR